MITPGLQRITQLLKPMFKSHNMFLPWNAIHIAGTNGKGSVAALTSTLLSHLPYNVGRFTSPHIVDRWDCITVDGEVVQKDKFLSIEKHFQNRSHAENIGASEFEILTATAFEIFIDREVDVAVVECGLGGGQDATNVLRPEDVILSVITKVGLDHTDFLGDNIRAITAEKAGILKHEVPVVVDASNEKAVYEVVEKRLDELGWTHGITTSTEEEITRLSAAIRPLALAEHQIQNLHTAWASFRSAERTLDDIFDPRRPRSPFQPHIFTDQDLRGVMSKAQKSLPGRLQCLTLPPPLLRTDRGKFAPTEILVDGAHNAQSAAALTNYLDDVTMRRRPSTWLLAMKNDKDVGQLLSNILTPNDAPDCNGKCNDNVIVCEFNPVDGMPWVKPMAADDLAREARKRTEGWVYTLAPDGVGWRPSVERSDSQRSAYTASVIREAVRIAAGRDTSLYVTGSLYLVGDVLRCVKDAGGNIYG